MALYFKGLNLRCSAFYYSARTFLENGAVVTDRATAERSKMSIGAVGYSTDFYRAGYRKNSSNDLASKYTTMGSATQKTISSNNGKTIGVTTAGNTGLLVKYADSSTPAEPIIKVGDYEVRVKDVDPNNATELEMFALIQNVKGPEN